MKNFLKDLIGYFFIYIAGFIHFGLGSHYGFLGNCVGFLIGVIIGTIGFSLLKNKL